MKFGLNSSDQIGDNRFAGESKLIFNNVKILIEKKCHLGFKIASVFTSLSCWYKKMGKCLLKSEMKLYYGLLLICFQKCNYIFSLFLSSDCGGVLNEQNGEITSPGYPSSYPLNKQCTWVISAPDGESIELLFREFELEKHSNCRYDYLEIRDGDEPQMPLIGKFCGDLVPAPVRSSGNAVYIKFYSDGLTAKRGFKLKWQTLRQPPPPGPPPSPDGNKGKVNCLYTLILSLCNNNHCCISN